MALRHEIYADEAWTHSSKPLRRYWCFYGGIFGHESDMSRLDVKLRKIKVKRKFHGEIKWSRLSNSNLDTFTEFVDCLLDDIESGSTRFRQMFCDRSMVRVAPYGESPVSDLDIQFKLCYQFIKHSFGLEYLDRADYHEVLVALDEHSSQKHKKNLSLFCSGVPQVLGHPTLSLRVTYQNSENVPRIQACDLLTGAAGSRGNNMHMLREPGQRGMSAKQKARDDLSKHIYDRLRAINATDRGSLAFNWFESTGKDGDRANMLKHRIRIWKFKPRMYRVDEGWHNKNLDKYGQYCGPQIVSTVQDAEAADISY